MQVNVKFLGVSLEALARADGRCKTGESMDDLIARLIRYGLRCYEAIVAGGVVFMRVPWWGWCLDREVAITLPEEPFAGVSAVRFERAARDLLQRNGDLPPEQPARSLACTLCLDDDLFYAVEKFAERYTGNITVAYDWLVQLGERVDWLRRGDRALYRRTSQGEEITIPLD